MKTSECLLLSLLAGSLLFVGVLEYVRRTEKKVNNLTPTICACCEDCNCGTVCKCRTMDCTGEKCVTCPPCSTDCKCNLFEDKR